MRWCLVAVTVVGVHLALAAEVWDGAAGDRPLDSLTEITVPPPVGDVELVRSPWEWQGAMATVSFDDARHHNCVNVRYYLESGISFERDD